MTNDELLDDINCRLDSAVDGLREMRRAEKIPSEEIRLSGKINGLLLVKDWLRSYR